jgi:hypothetical protein
MTALPEQQTRPDRGALERSQWRQLIGISVAAVALYTTLRLLPTGTNLNHMDFRAQGKNSIDFCDPSNPQFLPVVAVRSPVEMRLATKTAPRSGEPVNGTLTLMTTSGKAIAPADLLVVHTRPLHLMIVDPTLTDYQHVHPEPAATPGDWTFGFTPRLAGTYRLFADFTPIATARGLYASADLEVPAAAAVGAGALPQKPGTSLGMPMQRGRHRFTLSAAQSPIRARQPVDLRFEIRADNGGKVPLQPVMGAYAHLVAFDENRSGFAHLHPVQADPLTPPDPVQPVMSFKLTIPTAGRYVIWAQVNLGGEEEFVPFWFEVAE